MATRAVGSKEWRDSAMTEGIIQQVFQEAKQQYEYTGYDEEIAQYNEEMKHHLSSIEQKLIKEIKQKLVNFDINCECNECEYTKWLIGEIKE